MPLRGGIRNRLGNKTLACCVIFEGRLLGALSFIVYTGESAYRNNISMSAMGLAGPGGRQLMAGYLEKRGVFTKAGGTGERYDAY